jgi:eukaryotic-like serine/threonine-protein kinase
MMLWPKAGEHLDPVVCASGAGAIVTASERTIPPSSAAPPVHEGDILAGKYKVERILGQGGMGVVVAATHLQLEQLVALKFLRVDATDDLKTRFLREGKAAVRLKSEHVAKVLDVGELETGAPYIVMEYLAGSDLQALLEQEGRLPLSDAVSHVLEACQAIAEAHSMGIVHRDLKPANLFVTTAADGLTTVKVLDFGISKQIAGDGLHLTGTATMLGSPDYMSPEQMESARKVDTRADIWSIGAILYRLVTGRVPFAAESFPSLVYKIAVDPPPAPRSLQPDVPEELESAILRCLEKDPAKRYPSVAELAWAIVPFGPPDAQRSAERIARMLNNPLASTGRQTLPSQSKLPALPAAEPDWSAPTVAAAAPGSSRRLGTLIAIGVGGALLLLLGVIYGILLGR